MRAGGNQSPRQNFLVFQSPSDGDRGPVLVPNKDRPPLESETRYRRATHSPPSEPHPGKSLLHQSSEVGRVRSPEGDLMSLGPERSDEEGGEGRQDVAHEEHRSVQTEQVQNPHRPAEQPVGPHVPGCWLGTSQGRNEKRVQKKKVGGGFVNLIVKFRNSRRDQRLGASCMSLRSSPA